ncbi:transcription initiation factor TFIID subunit 8 [Paragonimus westermani]|uniref:Transcription initiation factor TFIID subunit 8 n=1 Tax=Paragonimus westermani TaxID=34504 RepID=A0A5J4NM75_9TREM|nr:transcription initiation factor TFIID subunit 8 [Paragonimus westermani]
MANRLLTGGECPQGVLDVIEGAIGYLALSNGFSAIEYAALRILSNMILSFIENVGACALSNAECTGRTTILLSDIILALIDLGFDVRRLEDLPRRRQYRGFKEPIAVGSTNPRGVACAAVVGPNGSTVIPRPLSLRSDWPAPGRLLGVGSGQVGAGLLNNENSVILHPMAPAHLNLPPLPEPHTFMRTCTKRPPSTGDPASLKRRTAEQRRKVQQSLVKFLARVNPVQYLFPGDPESFMIISPRKASRPYLEALLADCSSCSTAVDGEEQVQSAVLSKSKQPSSVFPPSVTKSINPGVAPNPYTLKPKFPEC